VSPSKDLARLWHQERQMCKFVQLLYFHVWILNFANANLLLNVIILGIQIGKKVHRQEILL